MKRNLLVSFLLTMAIFILLRWQGRTLITPLSRRGILDLEFARTPARFYQLRLFWNPADVFTNTWLDFIFIACYTWLLVTICLIIKERTQNKKRGQVFITLALAAAFFDICENFLMLLVMNGRFDPSVLQVVFFCALIKFILAGLVVLYILAFLPFTLKRGKVEPQ